MSGFQTGRDYWDRGQVGLVMGKCGIGFGGDAGGISEVGGVGNCGERHAETWKRGPRCKLVDVDEAGIDMSGNAATWRRALGGKVGM